MSSPVGFATCLRGRFRRGRADLAALLLAAVTLLAAATSRAQECMVFKENLITTPNCEGSPLYDKYFTPRKLHWGGHSYLVVDTGNDLKLWKIDNPLAPVTGAESHFLVPNSGDSDYDLRNYSVCDGCRYGIANFKVASVLFDLGTGGEPTFIGSWKYYPADTGTMTGFTFPYAGNQYVVSQELGSLCTAGSPVFRMTGVQPANLTKVGCVGSTGTPAGWRVQNGVHLADATGDYLYLADSLGKMFIFKVGGGGSALTFTMVGPQLQVRVDQLVGMAVDSARKLAVLENLSTVKLYDLSNLASPVELASHSLAGNLAAIGGPFLFKARALYPQSEALYGIEDFQDPSPTTIDPGFWSATNPWNQHPCEFPNGAVLSDDGTALYTSNYSVVKLIDLSLCTGPVARIDLAPALPFPGDQVVVTNASGGIITRSAIWITATSDPRGTPLVGTATMSTSTPSSRTLAIPADLAAAQEYWAHVAVDNDDYPCEPMVDPEACSDQLETRQIPVDRTPTAAIAAAPTELMTGDTVTLTAVAEGHPTAFSWTITPPTGSGLPPDTAGGSPIDVELAASGTWAVGLTAHYAHQSGGGTYSAVASWSKTVTSVDAHLSVPTDPLETAPIVLDGSSSRWPPGASISFAWTVAGPTPYTSCPHTAQCTIPANTLTPGDYTVSMTLTNLDNGDVSGPVGAPMHVLDGSVEIDFGWDPPAPEIGETVTFSITGYSFDVRAEWSFGGPGCAGYEQVFVCVPDYTNCLSTTHKYSTAGVKAVTVTVRDPSTLQVLGTAAHSLTVQAAGSCPGECAYTLTPSTRSLPATAGTATVDLVTAAGCAWQASSGDNWTTITSPLSGSGPGTVSYQVTANTGAPRAGTITVAGRAHVLQQQGTIAPGDCTQAGPHDDGTVENGYGWSAADALVERFTPATYPALYTGMCVAWTRSLADSAVDYQLLFLDDDGPGGGPGSVLGSAPATATGVPPSPDSVLVASDVAGYVPAVAGGSVWVGVTWDDGADSGFSVAADESPTTPAQQGFFSQDGGAWLPIAGQYPSYRALFVRPVAGAGPPWNPWQIVVGGLAGGGNGFGDPGNATAAAMAVFEGRLYVGSSGNAPHAGELWVSDDGLDWAAATAAGFGDPDVSAVSALAVFDGRLYAGTLREGGSGIWRSADGVSWEQMDGDGFGDPDNQVVQSLAAFDGLLVAATGNPSGLQIWRSDDGATWSEAASAGLGNPLNLNAPAMAAFGGALYVATDFGIWRTTDGSSWTEAGPATGVRGLAELGGRLYAGLAGGQVVRSDTGDEWSTVMAEGFGDSDNGDVPAILGTGAHLYAGLANPTRGAQVWSSADGSGWTQASWSGFGDPGNLEAPAMVLFHGDLYVGTGNADGLEVWRLLGADDRLLLWDGFESSDTSGWTASGGPLTVVGGAAYTGDWGVELSVTPSCTADDQVALDHQTVTAPLQVEACTSISAGDGFVVAAGGDVTFTAGRTVALGNGFSVLAGGALTLITDASLGPFAFVEDASPSAETSYNAEFWVNLDNLVLGAGNQLQHLVAYAADGSHTLRLVVTTGRQLALQVRDDAGVLHATSPVATAAGWNHVVVAWRAAAGATATLAVNDGPAVQLTGIDTATRRIERVRWGVVGGSLAGSSGTIAIDDYGAWR